MHRPCLLVTLIMLALFGHNHSASLLAQSDAWTTSPRESTLPASSWNQNPIVLPERIRIKPVAEGSADAPGKSSAGASKSNLSIAWTLSSLAFVCGLMLIGARLFRKKMGISAQSMPSEVLNLLGRKQLTSTHQMFLVRLGSKVLLIGAGVDGLRTLSEITDPLEVDLLTGLCQQHDDPATSSQQFLKLFQRSITPSAASLSATTGDPYDRLRHNLDATHGAGLRGSYDA